MTTQERLPLKTRIAAAAKRLEDLKAERGAATLEGRFFDHSRIAEVEHEIAGLEEAEAEERRRTSQAKKVEKANRIPDLLTAIGDKEEQRLAAVGRAEAAAKDLASALQDVLAIAAEERGLVGSFSETVTGNPNAIPAEALGVVNMPARLSKMLALTLMPVTGGSGAFGDLRLTQHTHGFSPDDAWTTVERREGKGLLGSLERAPERYKAA